ncbi:hypothetical protein KP004_14875 [Geomonas oryzisoli]|uniref:6-bladed beta-propeller n=1 Tax=Geomonas oryzisoli TaxID=2847992 RepID=A0ABX8J573_9BACT|nr:hypothetical protein [Geomonas oryzisoli]QWV92477.1 hypothetical protein KP004_14875 [Geomonas oryzisoli]
MTLTDTLSKNLKRLIAFFCVGAALSGCAASKPKLPPAFFPPPPDEPHIQYLMGINNSSDLGSSSGGVGRLLLGGSQVVTSIGKPYGIAYKKGKVYVCDVESGQVIVIDIVQNTMRNLSDEAGAGELRKPIGVAVDDDGNVYVADSGRKDIAVYDDNGKFLRSLGKGLAKRTLVGVAVYKDFVVTVDNASGLIFVLDRKSGEVLNTLGNSPDSTKNPSLPNGLTVDKQGFIHVVNVGNGTVKEYDLDGNMRSSFGTLGDVPGQFTRPRGIDVDDDGNIFVVDAGHGVVQVFNSERRILGDFGRPGLLQGSLNLPAGVVTTKDHVELFQKYAAPGFKLTELIFVTNQFKSSINKLVAVYGMGVMAGWKPQGETKVEPKVEPKGEPKPGVKTEPKEKGGKTGDKQ